MSDQENWEIEKPRKVNDPDREVKIWAIDWDALPSYDDYEVNDE